ncbi:sialidase family protein [Streptomyces sp. HPF1205]|uniref:sialidase family protein n=1 Tax=Streptomyces sp. HPF1205 TaxID=2873262 RepID=UPI001CEDCB76|nr:sialidase family protein [Streptomyces sp. HPF1205]
MSPTAADYNASGTLTATHQYNPLEQIQSQTLPTGAAHFHHHDQTHRQRRHLPDQLGLHRLRPGHRHQHRPQPTRQSLYLHRQVHRPHHPRRRLRPARPQQLSPASDNTVQRRQGSQPAVGPDGTVYVVWEESGEQVVATSADGGTSWSRPVTAGPVADIQDPIPGANFRTDSFTSIAADPRTGSTTVWLAWVNRTADGGRVVVTHSADRGRTWAPLTTVSTAAEGYAFFQGLDVAPNGRVDVAYQGLTAKDPTTYGTGNAAINTWYTGKADGGSWTTPIRTSSAPSDPAAGAQNNLARQFWDDYSTLVSTDDHAWFIDTDSRHGADCPVVDAFQHQVEGTAPAQEDDDAVGGGTTAADGPAAPAPSLDCPRQFGNTDAYVSVITP